MPLTANEIYSENVQRISQSVRYYKDGLSILSTFLVYSIDIQDIIAVRDTQYKKQYCQYQFNFYKNGNV